MSGWVGGGREGRRKLAGKDSLVPPFLLDTQKWESDNIPLP